MSENFVPDRRTQRLIENCVAAGLLLIVLLAGSLEGPSAKESGKLCGSMSQKACSGAEMIAEKN